MLRFYQSLKAAGVLALSLSLIAPPAVAAGVARTLAASQFVPVQAIAGVTEAEVVEVRHRRDRRARRPLAYTYDNHVRRQGHGPRPRAHRSDYGWYALRSRHPRPGYRQARDGFFYPLAAFGLGVGIQQPHQYHPPRQHRQPRYVPPRQVQNGWPHIPRRFEAAHDGWCDAKYRSYSRTTKTFQPYNGPRRYCNSPYDKI